MKSKFFTILAITFFDNLSIYLIPPVLVFLFFSHQSHLFSASASHATRSLWYGAALSVNNIIVVFVSPLLGSLADRFGRKPILLIGTFGALLIGIFGTLGILLSSLGLFMFGRVIAGLCTRTEPVLLAAVGDIDSGANKMTRMGYLQLAIALGAFFGPILGGYFAQSFFATLNYSMPFCLAAIFGCIAFLLAFFKFKETYTAKKTLVFPWHGNWRALFTRDVKIILWILFTTQFTWSMYYQFIPVALKITRHFTPHQLGLFMGLIALWVALTCAFVIHALNKYFTKPTLLKMAVVTLLVGSLLTALTFHAIWLTSLIVSVADIVAYCVMVTLLSNNTNASDQGKIMGMVYFVALSMWALTSLLGGWLTSINPDLPLYVAPAGALAALFFTYLIP